MRVGQWKVSQVLLIVLVVAHWRRSIEQWRETTETDLHFVWTILMLLLDFPIATTAASAVFGTRTHKDTRGHSRSYKNGASAGGQNVKTFSPTARKVFVVLVHATDTVFIADPEIDSVGRTDAKGLLRPNRRRGRKDYRHPTETVNRHGGSHGRNSTKTASSSRHCHCRLPSFVTVLPLPDLWT
jgi:hypothetical protein